jgi:hypothetical protein
MNGCGFSSPNQEKRKIQIRVNFLNNLADENQEQLVWHFFEHQYCRVELV